MVVLIMLLISNSANAAFKFKDTVKVVSGFYSGCTGRIIQEISPEKLYEVEFSYSCDHRRVDLPMSSLELIRSEK